MSAMIVMLTVIAVLTVITESGGLRPSALIQHPRNHAAR